MSSGEDFNQVMAAAFYDELQKMASAGELPFDIFEKAAEANIDLEQMAKEALPSMASMGQSLSKGLGAARQGLNAAASKVPGIGKTLATPMSGIAHNMQHSPNSFVQGVGNVLHHQTASTGKGMLAMANPMGSAAELVAGGVGNAASKGLATAGGAVQRAAAAPAVQGLGAADTAMARGMTPKGQLMNAAQNLGGKVQGMFSPGGGGHTALTKVMPRAAELAGGVAGGALLHVPSLAGTLGGAGMGAVGAMAPGLAEAAHHAVGHFAGGAADLVHHGAADVLGTMKQGPLARGVGAMAGRVSNAFARNTQATPKLASMGSMLERLGSDAGTHKAELAGLGILAVPSIDEIQAHARARMAGDKSHDAVEKRTFLPQVAHPLMEVGGLGVLAGPSIAHLARGAH